MAATSGLEDQIKKHAEECGLTSADVSAVLGTETVAGAVGAPDGSRLARILDFLVKILPLVLPLLGGEKK